MFETSPTPTYEVYNSMKWILGIQPDLDHYTCMVDLLGQYGKLKEALAIIVKMAIFPDGRICGVILAACKVSWGHKTWGT